GMPKHDGSRDAPGVKLGGERRGEARKGEGAAERLAAVARQIPHDRPRAVAQALGDRGEHAPVGADTVQENERPRRAAPWRLCGHAGVSTRRPSSTTGCPSNVMVQLRTGRSKWPLVKRLANSLAPVENRKLPAKARTSVPLKSR